MRVADRAQRDAAEASAGDLIYLKSLAVELQDEGIDTSRLSSAIADRIVFSRLCLDRNELASSSDPDLLATSAALPTSQSSFEYLVRCWRRASAARSNPSTRSVPERLASIDTLKSLCASYAGLSIAEPSMFAQPAGKAAGASEMVDVFLRRAGSEGLLDEDTLSPFVVELVRRCLDNENMAEVFEPILQGIVTDLVKRRCSFANLDWRDAVGAIRDLGDNRAIAAIVRLVSLAG